MQAVRELAKRIAAMDRIELVTVLTLTLLLMHSPKFWYVRAPLVVLSIVGLAFPWIRTHWRFWMLMVAFLAASVFHNWATSDNHKYLECYWALALTCAFAVPLAQRRELLAVNARLLLALCMLFATAWKAASPTYRDGRFFQFILLTDDRFEDLAAAFGGISLEAAQQNHARERALTRGYLEGRKLEQVQLNSSPQLRRLAFVLTWWTLFIEGCLAIVFFPPGGRKLHLVRNTLLLGFAATTYLVATVKGFGWLLMILGIAQCEEKEEVFVPLYIFMFLFIQIYTMPYADVALALMERTGG